MVDCLDEFSGSEGLLMGMLCFFVDVVLFDGCLFFCGSCGLLVVELLVFMLLYYVLLVVVSSLCCNG